MNDCDEFSFIGSESRGRPTEVFAGVAGGSINTSTFVVAAPGQDNVYLQAGAGQGPIVGISTERLRLDASGQTDGSAAHAGDNVRVYGEGRVDVPLAIGATVTRGQRLQSDSQGRGIPTTAVAGQEYGAISQQAGIAGEVILVTVATGQLGVP